MSHTGQQLAGLLLLSATLFPAAAAAQAPHDGLPHGAKLRMAVAADAAGDRPGIYVIAFAPDGRTLATRDGGQTIRLWNVADGKVLHVMGDRGTWQHRYPIRDLAFSPDGKMLASASWLNGTGDRIIFWETATGRPLAPRPTSNGAMAVRFLPDGKTLVAARGQGNQGHLVHYAAPSGEQGKQFSVPRFPLAFSPDGNVLAAVQPHDTQNAAKLVLLDSASGEQKHGVHLLNNEPLTAAFSADGRRLATCGLHDRLIDVWPTSAGGGTRLRLEGHEHRVLALDFSPDGRFLASGGLDHTVRIWELAGGAQIARLEGHQANVCAVKFSPDGRHLATGSSGRGDNSILLWDVYRVTTLPGLKPEKIDADALAKLWKDLAAEDAARGQAAIGSLAGVADRALPMLHQRLASILVTADVEKIQALIEQLNDDRFIAREKATAALKQLRPAADALLRKTLEDADSAEVRLRVKLILQAKLPETVVAAEDRRRALRIVYLLQIVGDERAKKLLEAISTSFPDAEVAGRSIEALRQFEIP